MAADLLCQQIFVRKKGFWRNSVPTVEALSNNLKVMRLCFVSCIYYICGRSIVILNWDGVGAYGSHGNPKFSANPNSLQGS